METDITLSKRLHGLTNVGEKSKVKDIYTLLFRDAIWYQAYQNIYSNGGAKSLEEFDKKRISKLIDSLKNKTYSPKPSKIKVVNGRKVNLLDGTDKLVQEACRIILNAIYDNKFSDLSHGFRQNRSCHTALKEVSTWIGIRWVIKFDIEQCFDNINREVLLNILQSRIDDVRFINLIEKLISVGYLENWKYNKTFSGIPQGGIISPILSNIYFNELDKFVESKCNIINDTPNERTKNPEYVKLKNEANYAKVKIEKINERIEYIERFINDNFKNINNNDKFWDIFNQSFDIRENSKFNTSRSLRKLLDPIADKFNVSIYDLMECSYYRSLKKERELWRERYKSANTEFRKMKSIDTSNGLNRLYYVRYADDFILGYIGTKQEAIEISNKIKEFIQTRLRLTISESKSNVTDVSDIKFLGYHISRSKYNGQNITGKNGIKIRRHNNRLVFKIGSESAIRFVKEKKYGDYIKNESKHRSYLINFDDIEIVKQYNAELRGLINYYKYASNAKHIIHRVQWLAHYSMLKTLGGKHKCSVAQVFKRKIIKVKVNENKQKVWYITAGNKTIEVFNIRDVETKDIFKLWDNESCNDNMNIRTINIRSSALRKLIADECELCGKTKDDVSIVLHHTNKIRNISKTEPIWKQVQKMRQRKTISVCHECHMKIHHN